MAPSGAATIAKPSLPHFGSCASAMTIRPSSTPACLIACSSLLRPYSTRRLASGSTATVAAAAFTEAAVASTIASASSLFAIDAGRFLLRRCHRVPLHARDAQREVRLTRELDLALPLGVVLVGRVLDDLVGAVDGLRGHVPRVEDFHVDRHARLEPGARQLEEPLGRALLPEVDEVVLARLAGAVHVLPLVNRIDAVARAALEDLAQESEARPALPVQLPALR